MIVGIGEMRMSSFDPEFGKGGDRKFRRRKRQVSGVLMTLKGEETGGSKRGGEGRTRASKGFPWSKAWVTGHEATIRSERETGAMRGDGRRREVPQIRQEDHDGRRGVAQFWGDEQDQVPRG